MHPSSGGLSANSSCICGKCHANSSGSGPHEVPYLSFPFPSSPTTQRHMPAFSALHLVFLIPVQLRRPPSTPRQNSGPVTCWGPLDFQSPQSPAAASFFPAYLCTYCLSRETTGSKGWRAEPALFTAISSEFYFHLLLFTKRKQVKERTKPFQSTGTIFTRK